MQSKENSGARIRVRVIPGGAKNQIVGVDQGIYRIKVAAQPVKGKANKTLKEFIARAVGVRKSDVEITAGERSRIKTVLIRGMDSDSVNRLLLNT